MNQTTGIDVQTAIAQLNRRIIAGGVPSWFCMVAMKIADGRECIDIHVYDPEEAKKHPVITQYLAAGNYCGWRVVMSKVPLPTAMRSVMNRPEQVVTEKAAARPKAKSK